MTKLTPVFEIAIIPGKGYHLRKAVVLSRKHVRGLHAYECMNGECCFEFRFKWPKDPAVLEHGVQVTCPECSGLYVEWLSFELDPRDVFLGTEEEWEQVPDGSIKVRKREMVRGS